MIYMALNIIYYEEMKAKTDLSSQNPRDFLLKN